MTTTPIAAPSADDSGPDAVERAINDSGVWLARADTHYERARTLAEKPETVIRARLELDLALYARDRHEDLRDLAHRLARTAPRPAFGTPTSSH
ncbi:hypothetical protein [Kitasatospora cineracea]|uniref:Uncharacterized protein n=1 Tax=Kitasatospora cineracea TaxID=88074 RepID=A0A3N4RRB3_9ACTN|nr:hypothetical protein [Kitasatospora cineracea]RPE26614.1 hypothetical protein EDD38_7675 [Kitasatospora cineracea]